MRPISSTDILVLIISRNLKNMNKIISINICSVRLRLVYLFHNARDNFYYISDESCVRLYRSYTVQHMLVKLKIEFIYLFIYSNKSKNCIILTWLHLKVIVNLLQTHCAETNKLVVAKFNITVSVSFVTNSPDIDNHITISTLGRLLIERL